MPLDLSGLTPATSDALARLKAGLAAQGYDVGDPVSAFRTYADQQQLYGNYQAGQAGQALPYPSRGAVALAARPGYSPHEFGVAFDLGLHGAALDAANKLAPGLGLSTIAGDPGHFQLANWRLSQPLGANDAPPTATASAAPARPVSPTPGLTLNSPMDLVAHVESGNRNIPQQIHDKNTDRGTPAGGYFQIIDPTWRTYAAKAGVDLVQYPTAMSAPRNIQAQVASAIPVNQWGPNTVAALQKQFPGIDTSKTLGEAQTAALGGSPGTTINSLPVASGGLPGFGKDQSNAFTSGVKELSQGLGMGQGQGQGEGQPKPPPMGPPPGARNVSMNPIQPGGVLQPMSSQIAQAMQQNAATPLTWQGASPGQAPYAGAGQQSAMMQAPFALTGSPYGLSLNSLMYDPSMMMGYGYG